MGINKSTKTIYQGIHITLLLIQFLSGTRDITLEANALLIEVPIQVLNLDSVATNITRTLSFELYIDSVKVWIGNITILIGPIEMQSVFQDVNITHVRKMTLK